MNEIKRCLKEIHFHPEVSEMRVTVITQQTEQGSETEVVIYCHKVDEEVKALEKYINAMSIHMVGSSGENTCQLRPDEIYYFEVVDGKVFAYLKQQVWQVAKTLEILEEELSGMWDSGFFRISKSCMVNLRHVEHLTSTMGNRIVARMENGEDVVVSRHYSKLLRAYLKAGGPEEIE